MVTLQVMNPQETTKQLAAATLLTAGAAMLAAMFSMDN
jgi:hypothetical protein